ncbi:sensor histidine kinase [Lysobacter korlensis]|uniref:histidine kinase n=1 Tax=Lysobacter korlensis TaxID=553636 RepID=A0ABV6S0T4_9GAMM
MQAPWSLQRRLIVGIVAVLAVLFVAVSASTVALLQNSLTQRLDQELIRALAPARFVVERIPLDRRPSVSEMEDMLRGQSYGSLAVVIRDDSILRAAYFSAGSSSLGDEQQSRLLAITPGNPPRTVRLGTLGDYRLAALDVSGDRRVVVGLPLQEVQATGLQLALIIALLTGVGILAAAALAAVVIRIALRPLDRVVATAVRVSELPLSRGEVSIPERVPAEDTDPRTEVGQVGAALNRLLEHVATALNVRQRSENKVRQFVSDASHELRTPLAAIRGYAELTRRGPHTLPDDVRHSLGRIESESIRMTSLVDELLLLARIDEGRTPDAKPVDLGRLVADAVSDARAAGQDHRWRLDLPEEPVAVLGDEGQLHQVVANLLTNARVHTPKGTEVVAAVERTQSSAVLTIADDGPGIPPELQTHLFERFVRGDRSRSRKAGSTGLGLAIVHAIVDAHDGTVAVESAPGRTVFRIELPSNGLAHAAT